MNEPQTTEAALKRGEITDNEAYFLLRFAGRMGYDDAMRRLTPWPRRLRKWFVWFGGWEVPELMQWDRGMPAWEIRREDGTIRSPTPVSLFKRLTIYDAPRAPWVQLRCFGGYLTVSLVSSSSEGWRAYWSPNGTPGHERARCFVGRAK